MVTNKKNVILATTGADCIDLFFYDPIKNVIGNSHSGRAGTIKRIAIKTIEKMKSEYGCNYKDIIVCICPCNRICHYDVDKKAKDIFYEEFKHNDIIKEKVPNERWYIDIAKANEIMLVEAGIKKENIFDSKICTECNSNIMHSYRVEGQGFGKNTAIIAIK